MLVRFSLENFRSFGERAQISMVANGRISQLMGHTVTKDGVQLLKGAYIYGANASGKSNLIKAVDFARSVILRGSAQDVHLAEYSKVVKDGIQQPGIFQFEILVQKKVYSYGFALSYLDGSILEEWLYELRPSGNEKCLFERQKYTKVTSGLNLHGQDKTRFWIYAEDIQAVPKDLFLTELAEKPLEGELGIFKKVYKWFEQLTLIFPDSEFIPLPFVMEDQEIRHEFEKLLVHFDTGITKVDMVETTVEDEFRKLPHEIAKRFLKKLQSELSDREKLAIKGPGFVLLVKRLKSGEHQVKKIVFKHEGAFEGFDLADESDGTQRLLDLAPLLFGVPQNSVIFIDEIDRSMHAELTREFVEMFYEYAADSCMQLIATTHETKLLDLDLVRRDEIWLLEKSSGSSQLISLDDYKVRADKVIEKDYLLGRYGAVPHFGMASVLCEEVSDYD